MLLEVIMVITKSEESKDVTNKEVLAWAKGVEAQKAQSMIINSLNETKGIDNIKTVREGERQIERKLQTNVKAPMKQSCSYCGSSHPPNNVWPMITNVQSVAGINYFR